MWSLGVSDETSTGVLYALQRSVGRLGKVCKCSAAVVQSAEHEWLDQTLGDFFTCRATDFTQSPRLKEATADSMTDVLLHRQLIVEVNAEKSYDCDGLGRHPAGHSRTIFRHLPRQ